MAEDAIIIKVLMAEDEIITKVLTGRRCNHHQSADHRRCNHHQSAAIIINVLTTILKKMKSQGRVQTKYNDVSSCTELYIRYNCKCS